MRLLVFGVLIYLAIGYLSHSSSNLKTPNFDTKVLGAFSPQINQGQKWLEIEFNQLKLQIVEQFFAKIKSSLLK